MIEGVSMKVILANEQNLKIKQIDIKNTLNTFITDNNKKNIVNIRYIDNKLKVLSNEKYKILIDLNKKDFLETCDIDINNKYYILNIEENKIYILYFLDDIDLNYKKYVIKDDTKEIIIAGKYYTNSDIILNDEKFTYAKISLKKDNNYYNIETNNLPYNIYKNENALEDLKINFGDMLFIDGLFLTLIDNFIYVYFDNNISISFDNLSQEEVIAKNYDKFINKRKF